MKDHLVRSQDGPLTWLTLNRPEKSNALSAELVEALLENVGRACGDGTRLLVLDGSGSNFCAGFDFTSFEESSDGDLALRMIRIETLLQQIYHAPCATLALAQGRNFGAGADLVAACQMRIATPDASFRLPGLMFGVVLGTRRLVARVGAENARGILSTARTFSADEAMQSGFLTQIAARDAWPKIVAERVADCALLSPEATAALNRRTIPDTRAEDMAELARSVSLPGLKDRIRKFRSGTEPVATKSTKSP